MHDRNEDIVLAEQVHRWTLIWLDAVALGLPHYQPDGVFGFWWERSMTTFVRLSHAEREAWLNLDYQQQLLTADHGVRASADPTDDQPLREREP